MRTITVDVKLTFETEYVYDSDATIEMINAINVILEEQFPDIVVFIS